MATNDPQPPREAKAPDTALQSGPAPKPADKPAPEAVVFKDFASI